MVRTKWFLKSVQLHHPIILCFGNWRPNIETYKLGLPKSFRVSSLKAQGLGPLQIEHEKMDLVCYREPLSVKDLKSILALQLGGQGGGGTLNQGWREKESSGKFIKKKKKTVISQQGKDVWLGIKCSGNKNKEWDFSMWSPGLRVAGGKYPPRSYPRARVESFLLTHFPRHWLEGMPWKLKPLWKPGDRWWWWWSGQQRKRCVW